MLGVRKNGLNEGEAIRGGASSPTDQRRVGAYMEGVNMARLKDGFGMGLGCFLGVLGMCKKSA